MKSILLIAVVFIFSSLGFAQVDFVPQADSVSVNGDDLPNFHEVVTNAIYRGAQPTNQGFADLAHYGIKTVLDLRNEKKLIVTESKLVTSLQMNFISVPLSGFFSPKDKDIENIEGILNTLDLMPIFVHCQHGEDRTGVVMGLYRVFTQHMLANVAYHEMEEYGFHPILFFLKHYFDEKTGL